MPLTHRRRHATLRQISAGGARVRQESTSLLILWLLSSLKQERSTLCLIQMLECPAAQAEIALHRVTADGLRGTAGRNMEPDASRGRPFEGGFAGPPVPRHGLAARRTHLRLRIQNAGNGLRDLHEAYARPAAQSRHGRKCRISRAAPQSARAVAKPQAHRPGSPFLRPLCLCRPRRLPLII